MPDLTLIGFDIRTPHYCYTDELDLPPSQRRRVDPADVPPFPPALEVDPADSARDHAAYLIDYRAGR